MNLFYIFSGCLSLLFLFSFPFFNFALNCNLSASVGESTVKRRTNETTHTIEETQKVIAKQLVRLWEIQEQTEKTSLVLRGKSTPRYFLDLFNSEVSQQLYKHHANSSADRGDNFVCLDWDYRYVGQYKQCTRFIDYQFSMNTKEYHPPSPTANGKIEGDFGGDLSHVPDKLIDLLICTQVFEHVAHFWNAFPNLSRVMKPNGIVIFTVPFIYRFHPCPGDFYRYSPHAIIHLLESNGFVVCQISSDGWRSAQMHLMTLSLNDVPEAEEHLKKQNKESLIAGGSNYQVLAQRVSDSSGECSLPKLEITNEIHKSDLLEYAGEIDPMKNFPIGKR